MLIKSDITFKEKSHQYFDSKGSELCSVSRLIQKFSHEFDPTGEILIASAKKHGVTPEELKKKWDEKKDYAALRGTACHKEIEYWVENKKIRDSEYRPLVEKVAAIKFTGKLFSETRLGSSKAKIAGTIDIVELFKDNSCDIHDLKSNEKIATYSYGKRMKWPLGHLWDSVFNHYNLQLSLYAYLLEEHGFWVDNLRIIHINHQHEITIHELKYLRADVENMIEVHLGNKKFVVEKDDFLD